MRRPTHRRRNLQWVPAPRSAWARARARRFMWLDEPFRSEMAVLIRQIQDAHDLMRGYRVRRVERATVVQYMVPST